MKYLKSFNESLSSTIDDIREFYIDFRDEWGFTETTNVHNPCDNECVYRFREPFFIRMSFNIGSQDVDKCYNNLKEMCERIKLLESEIRVYCDKSYSDGDLYLSVNIFPVSLSSFL